MLAKIQVTLHQFFENILFFHKIVSVVVDGKTYATPSVPCKWSPWHGLPTSAHSYRAWLMKLWQDMVKEHMLSWSTTTTTASRLSSFRCLPGCPLLLRRTRSLLLQVPHLCRESRAPNTWGHFGKGYLAKNIFIARSEGILFGLIPFLSSQRIWRIRCLLLQVAHGCRESSPSLTDIWGHIMIAVTVLITTTLS